MTYIKCYKPECPFHTDQRDKMADHLCSRHNYEWLRALHKARKLFNYGEITIKEATK